MSEEVVWKSMDIAPKDTVILIVDKEGETQKARWSPRYGWLGVPVHIGVRPIKWREND